MTNPLRSGKWTVVKPDGAEEYFGQWFTIAPENDPEAPAILIYAGDGHENDESAKGYAELWAELICKMMNKNPLTWSDNAPNPRHPSGRENNIPLWPDEAGSTGNS